MNILKNVVNKIAEGDKKTELASEKIELAGLKDMQQQLKEVTKNYRILVTTEKEFTESAKKLRSFGEIVEEQGKRLKELSLDLEKKVKDLGLDVPNEVNEYIKRSNDFIGLGQEAVEKSRI